MSENIAAYQVGKKPLPETLEAFRNHPSALLSTDPNFRLPTPEEIKRLRQLAGWSQVQAAKLVGVAFDPKKGSTSIRRWERAEDKPDHRLISYAAWRLMLIYASVVTVDQGLVDVGANYLRELSGAEINELVCQHCGIQYEAILGDAINSLHGAETLHRRNVLRLAEKGERFFDQFSEYFTRIDYAEGRESMARLLKGEDLSEVLEARAKQLNR